mmetsp:Transcript_41807/g.75913  ORF Transcript_41807/g.75913 Transcript_41807/m.75913 type:complete len:101 (-) Transcript_41807:1381-1683(-)
MVLHQMNSQGTKVKVVIQQASFKVMSSQARVGILAGLTSKQRQYRSPTMKEPLSAWHQMVIPSIVAATWAGMRFQDPMEDVVQPMDHSVPPANGCNMAQG